MFLVIEMLSNENVHIFLFGGKADIEKLKCHFKKLCDQEKKQAESWEIGNDARDNVISDFNQMTSWTSNFHPKLLREFVLAEYLQNNGGLGSKHHAIRESAHYFPILDYPNAAVCCSSCYCLSPHAIPLVMSYMMAN